MNEDNTTTDLPPGVIMAVRGRAGTADRVNANGRLYPAAVYRKVVRAFHQRTRADPAAAMLGELDHPEPRHGPRLEKTALRIVDLHLAGGQASQEESAGLGQHLEFRAHVLDTPHGRTLAQLLRAGVPVHISTRGEGTLSPCCSAHAAGMDAKADHEPYQVVNSDYVLYGIDAVVRAAHAGAAIATEDGGRRTKED